MVYGDDAIQSLREALAHSPQNVPLRRHLAQALLDMNRVDEAEQELREALSLAPENVEIKLDLARLYFRQGKDSQSLVIVEDLVKRTDNPAALVLNARLSLKAGEIASAVAQYKEAIDLDPEMADEELAERLGVVPLEEAGDVFEGRVREGSGSSAEDFAVEAQRPKINFDDVGGMEPLKEEIRLKIIYPLKNPDLYRAYGKSIGGGILMYGPPGCGKTHLARATAGEIQANFLAIGIHDVLDMWIGQSERNMASLFRQARQMQPCVLFFDEVDALGSRRSDFRAGGARQLVNQFLAEMDGVDQSNEGVLILAATNAPWHVDSAFRRPGRFDRILFVPPPDAAGRASILQIHCAGKPTEGVDFAQVAAKTEGFSGADLKAVVDKAIEAKLQEALKTGRPLPLTSKDLIAAARSLRPTTKEWFATARNYALYSNDGGVYDDVLNYLKLQ